MSTQPKSNWKLLANRQSRIDTPVESSNSKRKFTPLKDNSIRDSKIFERSRERSNSSFMELNKTKDASLIAVKQKKLSRAIATHPQPPAVISTIKNSEFKSIESIEAARQHASTMSTVVQLQRQFRQFKDKVTKLLQRQQLQINQLAKQIVNTFQFQLYKLKDLKVGQCQHCRALSQQELQNYIPQDSTMIQNNMYKQNSPRVKQLETLKQELNKKLQSISPVKNNQRETFLQKVKSLKEVPLVNFSGIHTRFSNVFDIFNQLKSDMSQMEQLKANFIPQQSKPQSPKNKISTPKEENSTLNQENSVLLQQVSPLKKETLSPRNKFSRKPSHK